MLPTVLYDHLVVGLSHSISRDLQATKVLDASLKLAPSELQGCPRSTSSSASVSNPQVGEECRVSR